MSAPSRHVTAAAAMRHLRGAVMLGAGFAILVAVLAVGNLASVWVPLPGPLIGMMSLFALLQLPASPAKQAVIACGEWMLKYYAFFFVPAGASVIVHLAALRADWLGLAASLLISSLLSLLATAWVMKYCLARFPAPVGLMPGAPDV